MKCSWPSPGRCRPALSTWIAGGDAFLPLLRDEACKPLHVIQRCRDSDVTDLRHACGRFESYEEDSEGVTVHFQGGRPGPVRARVLVGADGYFSAVRQQCLGDGPPEFGVRCPFCPALGCNAHSAQLWGAMIPLPMQALLT